MSIPRRVRRYSSTGFHNGVVVYLYMGLAYIGSNRACLTRRCHSKSVGLWENYGVNL